jgi:hypothetical protein
MPEQPDWPGFDITAERFIAEVRQFRAFVVDASSSQDERKQAYKALVRHAAMLDPHAGGYECAGVALKEACITWLDRESEREPAEEVSSD